MRASLPKPGRESWDNRRRAENIERDLDRLRAERVAVLRRVEIYLHDEIHGLEVVYNARAAQEAARAEFSTLNATIDQQLDALHEIPRPRDES